MQNEDGDHAISERMATARHARLGVHHVLWVIIVVTDVML